MISHIVRSLENFFTTKYKVPSIPSYDMPIGAGTFHPRFIEAIARRKNFSLQYIQSCRRPADSRRGINVNRMQSFYQYQVVFSPILDNMLEVAMQSIENILSREYNAFEWLEDDWSSPTLGAYGVGYELRCNGLEILQFTYFQKFGGEKCNYIAECTYGIERIAYIYMYNQNQNISSIVDLSWNDINDGYISYTQKREEEYYDYNFSNILNINILEQTLYETEILYNKNLIYPAYDEFLKANHTFNIIDHILSSSQRQNYIVQMAQLFNNIFQKWNQYLQWKEI